MSKTEIRLMIFIYTDIYYIILLHKYIIVTVLLVTIRPIWVKKVAITLI